MRLQLVLMIATICDLAVAIKGKSLKEAYGDVKTPTKMFPWHRRRMPRMINRFTKDYYSSRNPEDCDFPIELLLIQDLTGSFEDDITNMKQTQLDLMLETLNASHPGSAFATVSFKDKPLWPLGDGDDYCVAMASPLSTDPSVIKADYEKWAVYGGGDPPESSFHAILAAAQSDTPGWGTVPTAARLMVVVTDAAPHFADDGMNEFNLPAFSGDFDEANNQAQCVGEYYPSPEQVREAITKREAYLAMLVYDGSYDSELPRESWKWFNGFIDQTESFFHNMEDDSSNFWARLSEIISALEDIECGEVTTTEPPTTTSPAATTTPVITSPAEATTPVITSPAAATTPVITSPAAATTPGITSPAATTTPGITSPAATTTPVPPPECPTVCPPTGCDHCCCAGVLIKLQYRPQRLHLDVEK